MSATFINVRSRFLDADNRPVKGTVTFELSNTMQDPTANLEWVPQPITVQIDGNGYIYQPLLATNSPGLVPSNVTYTVTEDIDGAPDRSYSIPLPYDSPLGELWLADAAPAIPGPPLYQYALESELTQHVDSMHTGHVGDQTPAGIGYKPVVGTNTQASRQDHVHTGARGLSVHDPVLNSLPDGPAVGDGVTDDAPAINGALALLESEGGGRLLGALGLTYGVLNKIVIPTHVEWEGHPRGACQVKALTGFADSRVIQMGDADIVFGCRLRDLLIDCNDVSGVTGVYSDRINEQSGLFNVIVMNARTKGIHIATPGSGLGAQNFSLEHIEVGLSGLSGGGAIGIHLDLPSASFRCLRDFTVNSWNGSDILTGTGVQVDGAFGEIYDGHVENMPVGILLGLVRAASGARVTNITGGPHMTDVVRVSNATTQQNYCISGITPISATNALNDQIKGVVATGHVVQHEVGAAAVGYERIISTEVDIYPWGIDIDVFMEPITHTNWNTPTVNANLIHNGAMLSSGAQNDSIAFDVVTGAGAYAIEMMSWKQDNVGKYTTTIDGSSAGLNVVDGYAASPTYNVRDSIGTVLLKAGKHRIVLTMATRNTANTSAYYGTLQHLRFTRVA